MTVSQIAYIYVGGIPLVAYGGIATITLLFLTTASAVLNMKMGIHIIPFKWHPRLAYATVIMATLHALLALSVYLNF